MNIITENSKDNFILFLPAKYPASDEVAMRLTNASVKAGMIWSCITFSYMNLCLLKHTIANEVNIKTRSKASGLYVEKLSVYSAAISFLTFCTGPAPLIVSLSGLR